MERNEDSSEENMEKSVQMLTFIAVVVHQMWSNLIGLLEIQGVPILWKVCRSKGSEQGLRGATQKYTKAPK